jgi:hypothetical protein
MRVVVALGATPSYAVESPLADAEDILEGRSGTRIRALPEAASVR